MYGTNLPQLKHSMCVTRVAVVFHTCVAVLLYTCIHRHTVLHARVPTHTNCFHAGTFASIT